MTNVLSRSSSFAVKTHSILNEAHTDWVMGSQKSQLTEVFLKLWNDM